MGFTGRAKSTLLSVATLPMWLVASGTALGDAIVDEFNAVRTASKPAVVDLIEKYGYELRAAAILGACGDTELANHVSPDQNKVQVSIVDYLTGNMLNIVNTEDNLFRALLVTQTALEGYSLGFRDAVERVIAVSNESRPRICGAGKKMAEEVRRRSEVSRR